MEKKAVLVIAEDAGMAEVLAFDIRRWGYEPFTAISVGEALRLIAKRSFSVIVADYLGPREAFPYRWPILQLLARFAPRTPVLALSMFKEAPESKNLVGVVSLPDYDRDLEKGLKQHTLRAPEQSEYPFLARYLASIWDANVDEADRVVSEAIDAGWDGQAIYEDLFAAALHEIGDWWEDMSCTIADEHGARLITERLMARVSAIVEKRPRKNRSAVIACATGEQHELGARMVADLFAWDGWTVRLLGADTPAAELIGEIRGRHADVVGLSATMQPSLEAVKSEIAGIRALGTRAVILGGQAFDKLDERAVAALGATAKASRASSGVDLANRHA